ncbi:substrate-binding domain-containing protein [Streptomyces sp. NPDC048002]|uniref:substrate-binding domain-containing protein n=1 Tax=Streptomyces sp. NPDC048002 TaxID=3154344 RepID=UPI0033F52447
MGSRDTPTPAPCGTPFPASPANAASVPGDLSLIAWDDSTLCRLASPPLTPMTVDVHEYGALVAEAALDLIDGRPDRDRWSPVAHFVSRGSTEPAPK